MCIRDRHARIRRRPTQDRLGRHDLATRRSISQQKRNATTTDIPNADGSSAPRQRFNEAPPMIIDTTKTYRATMVTSKGTLEIVLDPLGAPVTVNSFVFLARWHYYDGVIFHRVVPGFVLQGGDPTGTGGGGPGWAIPLEAKATALKHERGMLSMARTSAPDSAGSQFFVCLDTGGVQSLNGQYAVFGKVLQGMDVV